MSTIDERKALEMMELNPDASKDEISKRYGILTRKFRTIEKDENGYTIEDITKAYNLLMGITYIDRKEEERQKALRENPPLLARITGKDPVKIENFFHYYKIHIIVGIIVIIASISIIRSCINRVPTDFSLVMYGSIYAEDQEKVSLDIKNRLPDIKAPAVEVLTLMPEDPEFDSVIRMKLPALIAAEDLDILLTDEVTFKDLAAQGMLLPLDDLTDEIGLPEESFLIAAEILETTEGGNSVFGPEKKYGIDITDSKFVKENGIRAEKVIATIIVNSRRAEKAIMFMKTID